MWFFIPIPRIRRRRVVYRSCNHNTNRPRADSRDAAYAAGRAVGRAISGAPARPGMIAMCKLSGLAIPASLIGVFALPDGWWSLLLLLMGMIGFPVLCIVFAAMSHSPRRGEEPPPRREIIEPSPKLPPDDGPLNPRMFYSDRR